MTRKEIKISVLANTSDPSWRGQLTTAQIDERAYCFTDIYLGQVRYEARHDRPPGVLGFGSRVESQGVIGHLFEVRQAITGEAATSVGTYLNEWRMGIEPRGDRVVLRPPEMDELALDRAGLATEVCRALSDALQLIEATANGRPLPKFLDEVRRLCAGMESPPRSLTHWNPTDR